MLEPGDRQLLADILRAPHGYQFDRAVSTTYTLDLLTLLTLPVAFTLYQWADGSDRPKMDPLALLEAVRRHAQRIHVFCEAGRIAVPRNCQLLFGYLEQSVMEARAPKGGAFHPKVTVVRYTSTDNEDFAGNRVFYRFLCASRNLTFDRSWDTLLNLEGELAMERTRAIARNRPLSEFIGSLPNCVSNPIRKEAQSDIDLIADELLRVKFAEPEGFKDMAFWPIGIDNQETWPFAKRTDNVLVISPFVDGEFLSWIEGQTKGKIHLVSRPESLDAMKEDATSALEGCFVLNDATEQLESQRGNEPDPDGASGEPDSDGIELQPANVPLRGLHAKAIVADAGWVATIWTGSANATKAAFTRNVEFLVELSGTRKKHGTESLLGESEGKTPDDRRVTLRDLLVRYQKGDQVEQDPLEVELEKALDTARKAIVEGQLTGIVKPQESNERLFDVVLRTCHPLATTVPQCVKVAIYPITLRPDAAIKADFGESDVASYPALSMEGLTRFFAFQLVASKEGKEAKTSFVLNLPINGLPTDRDANLLMAMLSNRERLLRYLLMLISDSNIDPLQFLGGGRQSDEPRPENQHDSFFGLPLLEPLLHTLSKEPQRLDRIATLIRDLEETEGGRELVPEGFRDIWEPIWAARKEVKHESR